MSIEFWITDFVILLITLSGALYLYSTRKFNHWKNKNVPFIPPLPIFGNAFKVFTLRQNIGQFTRKIYESTIKPYIGFFIGDEPYLLIRDPELVKTILVKDFDVFSNRSIHENKSDDPMGSHILFILKTPDWRDMRRKMTPAFTSGKMRNMYPLVQRSGEDLVNYLRKESDRNPVIDSREVAAKYTTDVITSTSFGIEANCFKYEDSEFRDVSRRVFNWAIWERAISTSFYFVAPNLIKLFRMKFVDKASSDFLREVFWRMMRDRQEKKFVRNDLLDILIELKKQENIDDPYKLEGDKLVAQATMFFIAGFETSSSTISFTLYELAVNKDIQDKLRAEIKTIVNKYGEISYNCLNDMDYLEMCIKETLRKYPVLPFLDRRCSVDYQIPGTDVVLEKGSPVFISILGIHNDPKYYPDPDKYDPTRHNEENIKTRPSFTYFPFGEGPRNCIEKDKLVAQATQFFIAGFETSSSAISFTLYELAVNKDIQDKLRTEIKNAVKKHGDFSYDSLKDMQYLDWCIKETLRKCPIFPFLDSDDYKIPGTDVVLEKGSPIFVSILGIHHDPKYFPDPKKYDPTRYDEENVKTRPSFTYLAFGDGPRSCIGARFGMISSKSEVAHIINEFKVELCEETRLPNKLETKGVLIAPQSGRLPLKFKNLS